MISILVPSLPLFRRNTSSFIPLFRQKENGNCHIMVDTSRIPSSDHTEMIVLRVDFVGR